MFKVGPPDVFVQRRRKSSQIPITSKIPQSSFMKTSIAKQVTSTSIKAHQRHFKGVSKWRQFMKCIAFIEFLSDLDLSFGEFGRTKRRSGKKDFCQGKSWNGISALFFLILCITAIYKKKKNLPPFVEGMVQLHFLQSETSLFSILSRPQFPCLYVTNIPTEVAWGIKWRDPFNIQIKWKTITWCLHNMLIKKPMSQQWNQREKS